MLFCAQATSEALGEVLVCIFVVDKDENDRVRRVDRKHREPSLLNDKRSGTVQTFRRWPSESKKDAPGHLTCGCGIEGLQNARGLYVRARGVLIRAINGRLLIEIGSRAVSCLGH